MLLLFCFIEWLVILFFSLFNEGKVLNCEATSVSNYLMSFLFLLLADRSIRPLFPAGYFYDTQVGSVLGLFVSRSIKNDLLNLYLILPRLNIINSTK